MRIRAENLTLCKESYYFRVVVPLISWNGSTGTNTGAEFRTAPCTKPAFRRGFRRTSNSSKVLEVACKNSFLFLLR
jgi:hypothetical protein